MGKIREWFNRLETAAWMSAVLVASTWTAAQAYKFKLANEAYASTSEQRQVYPVRSSKLETITDTRKILPHSTNPTLSIASKDPQLAYLDVYDGTIQKEVKYFNDKLNPSKPLNPARIKAMIHIETGEKRFRKTAFAHDPMQIANKGDYAFDILKGKKENTGILGDFSVLKIKQKTPWNSELECWDYRKSSMDANTSIHGGVGWLFHKAAIYGARDFERGEMREDTMRRGEGVSQFSRRNHTTADVVLKYNPGISPNTLQISHKLRYRPAEREMTVIGWRRWDEATERYNGGGNPNYLEEVKETEQRIIGTRKN